MTKFLNLNIILSLNIVFILANSADPNEMPHYMIFHRGFHNLQKYPYRGFHSTKS